MSPRTPAELTRRMVQRRREAGRCLRCGGEKEAERQSKTMCGPCAAKTTKYQLGRRNKRLAAGKCSACGKAAPRKNRTMCAECAAAQNANSHAYVKRHPERRRPSRAGCEQAQKHRRDRYARLKAAGICVGCGKAKVETNRIKCRPCADKNIKYQQRRRLK